MRVDWRVPLEVDGFRRRDRRQKHNMPRPANGERGAGVFSFQLSPGSMVAIEGMERETAHRLMRRLKLHAIGDEFCYAHRYRRGDLLMWDNTATLHCARPIGAPTGRYDRRLLFRIVPLGLPRPLSSSASEAAG